MRRPAPHRHRHQRRRFTHHSWAWLIVLLLAGGVWIDGYGLPTWDRGVTIMSPSQPSDGGSPQTRGRSVTPRDVIDGDTVRLRGGQTFRLVGFDTPETGRQARCAYERELANRATARVQTMIRTAASAILEPIQCSFPPGTHGPANAIMVAHAAS